MPRKRKTPFSSWQTTKGDGIEERYIRLGNSQLLHPAFVNLGDKAIRVYINMLLESGGKKEFTFPYNKYKDYVSKAGFQAVKAELIEKGFIREKQNNSNLRKPNIYEFVEDWKHYVPP